MRQRFWKVGCLILTLTCGALAQTDVHPKFEVASIRPTATDEIGSWYEFPPGGRVNIINKTLKERIEFAWGIQPFQISGGPPWLDSVRYDLSAKSEIYPKMDEIPRMLQALLADRFRLAVHRGIRELPIFELVMARKDRKLGPRLAQSKKGSCTPFDQPAPRGQAEAFVRRCGSTSQSPSRLAAIGVPIAELIPMLSSTLGRLRKSGDVECRPGIS